MISAEAAGLAIAIAKGVIKLAGRIDRLTAEKEAVTGQLIIPMPPESDAPDVDAALSMLREYLDRTKKDDPDPLAGERGRLEALLRKTPVPDDWIKFFEKLFPEQAHPPAIRPDAEYLKALKKWVPTVNWDDKENTQVRQAAFYIAAGRDQRGLGYGARLGLLVADVIAEFGAENTSLFIRDQNAQMIVQSVLQRFSKPDLEGFEDWSPFLRHALSATLNGLLDARTVFDGHAQWADALFEALARARDSAENPDDYLLGLVRGRGYSLLIGEGLQLAGETLSSEHAGVFRDIVATFLIDAAPLVKKNKNDFGTFFNEHWGDLVRGGISAVAKHGPQLLEGKSPLLRETLLAVMNQLAATPSTAYFSSDTVLHLAEAAIGAVARDPALLEGAVGEKWLKALISSIASTINDSGLRAVFGRDGLERIFKDALATFAQHPELIIAQPGLAQDVVASVLEAVAESEGMEAWPLANAAVTGALHGLSKHPELAGTNFGPYVAELAGLLAQQVKDRGLAALQAADLIDAAVEAMQRNPRLFATLEKNVTTAVLQAVLKAADQGQGTAGQVKLLAGTALVEVARDVLAVVARYGTGYVENSSVKLLGDRVAETLSAGLARANKEMGRRMDQTALPVILAALVRKLLRGELADLDPESENFKKLFSEVADAVAT